MNPERWKKIDELLDEVIDLPHQEREKFLEKKCGSDQQLYREVKSLLKAHESADDFIEMPAMRILAKDLAREKLNSPDYIGKKFGNYTIERPIGEGGMGRVYLAFDEKLKRRVAIKILPSEYKANDERVNRFGQEARAISALNHPNIVTIYDVGVFDDINYIATEYVNGKTLRELVAEGISLRVVLNIIIQCCDALSAAHKKGIIHRDIKPENIIVRPDGYVKILDFGLAKLTDNSLVVTKEFAKTGGGVLIGTPAYMSPAQVFDLNVDKRTDLWSIAVVLYELSTGINPFKKGNRNTTFRAIMKCNPPAASSLNSEIPDELDRILTKAFDKNADKSYQTAAELRDDLLRLQRQHFSAETASIGSGPFSGQFKPGRLGMFASVLTTLLIVISVLTVAGFLYYFYFFEQAKPEGIVWTKAKNIQVTFTTGIAQYPSLSVDGKSFVYTATVDDKKDIFWQRIGGKNAINLTEGSNGNNSMPAFSPDGKLIAFRSERDPPGIYLMEETGENVRHLSDTGYHPSWSPDGKNLVVSEAHSGIHTAYTIPQSALWIIDVETGTKRQLKLKGNAVYPNWSPNGSRIAFWFIEKGRQGDIATVSADGGDPLVVTDHTATDWNPVWSPDGKYLYFASDRGGNMNIWRVPIDEKSGQVLDDPESVPTPTKYCRHITFSPDGQKLAYVRYESQSNIQSLDFDERTNQIDGGPTWITRENHEVSFPDLSPDGQKYVVRMPTLTEEDLVVFDHNGQNKRFLTRNKFHERNPRWSPDGKEIFFHSNKSGKLQIWSIRPDGTNLRQITFTKKTGATDPVLSPDGNKLLFTEIDGQNRTPMILDLSRNWREQSPLTAFPAYRSKAAITARNWSPDGRKILVNYNRRSGKDPYEVGVIFLEEQKYKKIAARGYLPVWLKDSRRFVFTDDKSIYLGDVQNNSVKQLYKPPRYDIHHANISPDNKFIFYRFLQINSDVWILDASELQPDIQRSD